MESLAGFWGGQCLLLGHSVDAILYERRKCCSTTILPMVSAVLVGDLRRDSSCCRLHRLASPSNSRLAPLAGHVALDAREPIRMCKRDDDGMAVGNTWRVGWAFSWIKRGKVVAV